MLLPTIGFVGKRPQKMALYLPSNDATGLEFAQGISTFLAKPKSRSGQLAHQFPTIWRRCLNIDSTGNIFAQDDL